MVNKAHSQALPNLSPSRTSRRRFIGCGCTAAAALALGPGFLAACSRCDGGLVVGPALGGR
jgi:spermidine/putrescine transport system substrate-binding protein